MSPATIYRRMPRAGLDKFDGPATAIATLSMVIHRPPRWETVLLLLDHDRCGRAIVTVAGTTEPDAAVDVVEFACTTCEQLGGLVVASVRPDESRPAGDERDVDHTVDRDIDRWLEMSEIAELHGVELFEWFVVGRSISCPRDQLGEPPRW